MKIEVGSEAYNKLLELAKEGKKEVNFHGLNIPIEALVAIEENSEDGDIVEIEDISIDTENDKFIKLLAETENELIDFLKSVKPNSKMKFHFITSFIKSISEKTSIHFELMKTTGLIDEDMLDWAEKVYVSYKQQ